MDESLVLAAGGKAGVRPVRLKGFHRAVKRGEAWALRIWKLRDRPLQYLLALAYRAVGWEEMLAQKSPVFESLKKTPDSWLGGTLVVPLPFHGGLRKRSRYRGEGKK